VATIDLTRTEIDAAGEIDWDLPPARDWLTEPEIVRGQQWCPLHHVALREGKHGGLYCPSRETGEYGNSKGFCKLRFLTKR